MTREQVAREVQRKTSLVGAHVQSFAVCMALRRRIVQPLVEKGPGLLSRPGVIVKRQSVDVEDGRELRKGLFRVERIVAWRAQLLELLNARVGALDNGRRVELGRERLDDRRPGIFPIESFGEDLEENEVSVAVDDDARELVGLARRPGGRRRSPRRSIPSRNVERPPQTLVEQCQPGIVIGHRDRSRSAAKQSASGDSRGPCPGEDPGRRQRRPDPNLPQRFAQFAQCPIGKPRHGPRGAGRRLSAR